MAKLTKANPNFYKLIGARGGKSTLKKHGKKHFSKAAALTAPARERNRQIAAQKPTAKKRVRLG